MTALAVICFLWPAHDRTDMQDNLLSHPYLCGIGGIGISGTAHLLIDMGLPVVGSDLRRSVLTQDLEQRGAVIEYAPNPKRVRDASCVIAPSSFPASHPELQAARAFGIERLNRCQALAHLCQAAGCLPILCFGTTARGKLARLASDRPKFGWCAGAAAASSSAPRHAMLAHTMMLDIDEREFLADPDLFSQFPNMDILISDWQNDEFGYYGNDPRYLPENFAQIVQTFQSGPNAFLVMPENSHNSDRPEFTLRQKNRVLERFQFELDFEHGVLKSPKQFHFDDIHFFGTRSDASALAAAQTWLFARQMPGIQNDLDCVGWFNRLSKRQFHDIRMHPVNVWNSVETIKAFAGNNPVSAVIKPFSSTLNWYKPEYWRRALAKADHIFVISPPYEGCSEQDCLEFAQELKRDGHDVEVTSLKNARSLANDNDFWLWIGADDLI